MPKQFDVSSVDFVNFGLSTRQFDVKLNGQFAGAGDADAIDLEDKGEDEDLKVIRFILSKLPAAYGSDSPVAFSLMLDDHGDVIVPAEASARALEVPQININTADATTLATVPWIGPAIAKSIIAKRPFTTVDELQTIDGIGATKLAALKPFVTV